MSEMSVANEVSSRRYYERAKSVLAGGVGHDLRYCTPYPLYIQRGAGGRKWDVDGNEYVDFLLGNGALLLGHAPPDVIDAITAAAQDGTHFGNDHPLHIEWAEWVQRLIPSAERVRFVNSGTEATLLAIRLARAFTGRSKLVRFTGHFHGWHDDVVHGFQPPFEADGSLGVPADVRHHLLMIPDADLELVEQTLAAHEVAGVILEPSGASWGRVPISTGFLRGLREITARSGVPLIFDEVVTGFRFSTGGAQKLYGITPDLSCLAKVVAGGMPGGAVVGRSDIMELFDLTGDADHDRYGRVTHFGTFNASPLSAAAGVAALKRIATGRPIETANAKAAQLRQAWDAVLDRHSIAGYVYGECSTFHVYFETDPGRIRGASSRQDLVTTSASRLKGMPPALIKEYQRQLRKHGVDIMSSTGGVLSCEHGDRDLEHATDAFEKTVRHLLEQGLAQGL